MKNIDGPTKTGLKRNLLEQFYTKTEVAKRLCSVFEQKINIDDHDLIIEPAAGTGNWCSYLHKYNLLSYDIEPQGPNILEQDFLQLNLTTSFHIPLHFVGNPPFGRQASLAKKFIRSICSYPKTKSIAFILPKSFKKDSFQKVFPLSFHLIHQEEVEDNAFIVNGEDYTVPCVFKFGNEKIIIESLILLLNQYIIILLKKKKNLIFSLRRVGVYAGKIDSEIDSKSIQSHYFIKLDKNIDNFIEKYNSSVKFEHNNTVGAKSISKQEFIKEINKIV